jgi:galactokinase
MALFVDARELTWRHVPLPNSIELVVINSGVRHQHSAGDYNTRRSECEQACRLLGIGQLRDLSSQGLERVAQLPEPLNRRARHVITENERVLQAVVALETGDVLELGRLCDESHRSQRDDYAVSIPEIDRLVQIARTQTGVFGARLTGGGFGGSIVVLAEQGRGAAVGAKIVAAYGDQATVLVPGRSP